MLPDSDQPMPSQGLVLPDWCANSTVMLGPRMRQASDSSSDREVHCQLAGARHAASPPQAQERLSAKAKTIADRGAIAAARASDHSVVRLCDVLKLQAPVQAVQKGRQTKF